MGQLKMFDNKNSFTLLSVILISILLPDSVQGLDGNEGDNCFINSSQQEGNCTKILDCEKPCSAEYVNFKYCKKTLRGEIPIVCCPKARPIKSISAKKCLEYKELACTKNYISTAYDDAPIVSKVSNCASNTQPVIIGGEEAQRREFPHMALLGWVGGDYFGCGGTLISDQYVLSAAHCFNSTAHGPLSYVRLGEHDQSTENESNHTDVRIAELIPHPNYQKRYNYYDIGLVKLEHPISFTDAIRPACLPEEPMNADIVNVTATGWGYLRQRQLSSVLLKVNLDVFSHEKCDDYNVPNRRSPQGILEEDQFCAGSDTHINNTCLGDSGGPLQIKHKYHYCTFTIIGITSFGEECTSLRNQSIGVYTQVFPYLSWIESIVWPESLESK